MISRREQLSLFCRLWCFILMTLFLDSCVDLTGGSYHKKIQESENNRPQVYTMLGGLGIFSTGMNQLKDAVKTAYHAPASSTMWYKSGEVSRLIAKDYLKHETHQPIVLVGHSLGANEQIMVARYLGKLGIPVDLLITVDSVSVTKVSSNVREVLNIYKPGIVPMFSGLRLKAANPESTLIHNVNVNDLAGVHVNHFTIDKHELVQNMMMNSIEKVLNNANRKAA